jgi:DNA-directed RNA polymerase subunit M/transcription elongation factor TFIIS
MKGKHAWATKVIDMAVCRFRSCPRCHGDMFLERERDGWHLQCLQCSYEHELNMTYCPKKQPGQSEKESTVAAISPRNG